MDGHNMLLYRARRYSGWKCEAHIGPNVGHDPALPNREGYDRRTGKALPPRLVASHYRPHHFELHFALERRHLLAVN